MNKTKTQAILKDLQKKGMTSEEVYEDIVQILADDSPSYATEEWAAKFKWDRNCIEVDLGQVVQKPKSPTNKLMPFTVLFWLTDVLLFSRSVTP